MKCVESSPGPRLLSEIGISFKLYRGGSLSPVPVIETAFFKIERVRCYESKRGGNLFPEIRVGT